jgi:hypothetical protein
MASARCASPSANKTVFGFVDSLAACLNLLPAVSAPLAALLTAGTVSACTDIPGTSQSHQTTCARPGRLSRDNFSHNARDKSASAGSWWHDFADRTTAD